jgi:hypothetical protein
MRTIRPTRCCRLRSVKLTRLPTRKSARLAISGGGVGLAGGAASVSVPLDDPVTMAA